MSKVNKGKLQFEVKLPFSQEIITITSPHPSVFGCKCGHIGVLRTELQNLNQTERKNLEVEIRKCDDIFEGIKRGAA